MQDVIIRPIAKASELEEVYFLTHRCYIAKQFAVPRPNHLLIHYPHFDYIDETTIWGGFLFGKLVGSISVTRDSRYGLTLDENFKAECDQVRAEGRKPGAAWRLVVDPGFREGSRIVLKLIHAAIADFLIKGGDTFLLTVNPDHEEAYQRILNMRTLARRSDTIGLKSAPAVLMCGFAEAMPKKWKSRLEPNLQLKKAS